MELRIMAEQMKETASVLRGFTVFGAAAGSLLGIRLVNEGVKGAKRKREQRKKEREKIKQQNKTGKQR